MKTTHTLPIAMVVALLHGSACTSSFRAGIDNSSSGGSGPASGGGVGSGTGGVAGAGGTDAGATPDLAPDGRPATVAFASVSAGYKLACGLRTDGTMVCWGGNGWGQAEPPAGTFASVSAGGDFACGVRTDGTIACWGNTYDEPALPAGAFASFSLGWVSGFGLRTDGTLVYWGPDVDDLQILPAGTFASVSVNVFGACGLRTDGTVTCWGDLIADEPFGTFASVSAGAGSACGVRADGTIACWGGNSSGETTPPAGTFASVSAGDGFACGVRTDGTLTCWGDNSNGQATPPAGTFASVSAGGDFACGVKTDGTIACWGNNSSGQATPPIEIATGTDAGSAPDLAPNLAPAPLQHRSTSASCPSQRGPGPACTGTMCANCSSDSQCIDGLNGRCFPGEGLVSPGGCSYDECSTDSDCGARTPCLCRGSSTDNSANMCDVGGNCAVDSDCGPGGYCSPSMETCYSANHEAIVEGRNYGGPNPYYCHTASDLCINDSDCASPDAGTATTYPPTYTPCAYNLQNKHWECTQLVCGLP